MDADDESLPLEVADPELRQMLGFFDVPAFARRGQDLELALERLHARLRRERSEMLEMVRLRLRQWSAAVEGPDAWPSAFAGPLANLWPLTGAEEPAVWGTAVAPPRRRRAIARDLIASVGRFNGRWEGRIGALNLDALNLMIDQYNRYYILEKECVLRSSRLAARHFTPHPHLTHDGLLTVYPPLPLPILAD